MTVSASREWRFVVRHGNQGIGAFKVKMGKRDVYVFVYERDGSSSEHVSYHASGQQHIKWRKKYRFYRRDFSGTHQPEIWSAPPPIQVTGRQQIVGLGWHLVDYFGLGSWSIERIRKSEIIDVLTDSGYDHVLFQFNVISPDCEQRGDYFGHDIFWRKCLPGFVIVEIEGVGMRTLPR